MSSGLSSEQAPTESLCCVFTDITDSTSLWEHDPMAMQISLTIHNSIVRDELYRWGGYEVKTTGDGFHIVFAKAYFALQFCLSVQESLKKIDWPIAIQEHRRLRVPSSVLIQGRTPGLAVGMGIHFGSPYMVELNPVTNRVDYYGPMVNKSARVQAQAGDDTIAVSDAFIAQLGSEQTSSVVLESGLSDFTRTRIVRRELINRNFEIGFKRECHLKGIAAREDLTLVHHVPTKSDSNTSSTS